MTHKELTKHIRGRIQAAGIKARVRMQEGNAGNKCIQVFGVTYDSSFTAEESHTIQLIAQCNRLTYVRGLPIDINLHISTEFNFYL